MKRSKVIILLGIVCILAVTLSGCATIKEWGKGVAGVSTKALEENRQNALKKSFALDYESCFDSIKKVLNEKGKESYIYAQDPQAKMIAVYLSQADVTPVGIFFTSQKNNETLIEISSSSTFAKEDLGSRIFAALNALIKSRNKEKGNDTKEKISNSGFDSKMPSGR